ncbi:zinc-binding alcohol dehydrogenase family protein [Herbiconiux sp. VKM Ac-1786]|uniref:zinc-binding alcohol dehydrogenase family protein n=1 Tax=Herbiconiux sp. VKM Ac-1786 TaxID=2783824 RepID=UPI00188CE772|nr:zinc-binding alcohol dehydrogenase family protein [Herbiconiux sp. VKM Ac-1786]MBF4571943.1 zinc-binding alcohol dehydrogenase family protein [Herbiconiux sp. VKM Ac-1786]
MSTIPSPESEAWVTTGDGAIARAVRHVVEPEGDEVLVNVLACGVCRTDLHIVDSELPRHRAEVVPGHQIVGRVTATGPGVQRTRTGELVGIAWLRETCGVCDYCTAGRENLCDQARFTGYDADGGFARHAIAREPFIYHLPSDADPVSTAPLLCAGIIGYRALRRAALPPGGHLGLYGFGSSAHITAALALASGASVSAMTRGEHNRHLAETMDLAFVGNEDASPLSPLDSAIIFAPAGDLVPGALRATAPGGTVVIAGIHLTDIPALNYGEHLFREKNLRSVTANTRNDGREFLRIAAALRIAPSITRYAFDDIPGALDDLRSGRASGSLVIDTTG